MTRCVCTCLRLSVIANASVCVVCWCVGVYVCMSLCVYVCVNSVLGVHFWVFRFAGFINKYIVIGLQVLSMNKLYLTEIELVNLYTENYCIGKANFFFQRNRKVFLIRALNSHFLLHRVCAFHDFLANFLFWGSEIRDSCIVCMVQKLTVNGD